MTGLIEHGARKMTNLITILDGAIYLLPVMTAIAFVTTMTVRSLRRHAW